MTRPKDVRDALGRWWWFTAGLLILTTLWGLTAWYVLRDRAQQLEFATATSRIQVQLLAENTAALFRQVELGLRSYPGANALGATNTGPSASGCADLRRTVLDLPGVDNAVILSSDGTIRCSLRAPVDVDFPRDELLARHRDAFLGFSIIPSSEERGYLTLGIRLDAEQGEFAGVLSATVPRDYFTERFRDYGTVDAELIALFDARQGVLARWPPGEPGTTMTEEPLLRGVSDSALVSGGLRSWETEHAVVAVFQLPEFAYRIVIASAKRSLLEAWWSRTVVIVAGALVLGVTIAGAGWWIQAARERRRRSDAELAASHTREQEAKINRLEGLRALAGGLAHDINNRMMVVLGNSQLLELDPAEEAHALRSIQDAARETAALSDRMLLAAGNAAMTAATFDAGERIAAHESDLQGLVGTDGELVLSVIGPPHFVHGDPNLIGVAVRNLVENAAEAMQGRKGRIAVAVSEATIGRAPAGDWSEEIAAGSYVAISVTDNGEGMDGSHRDRVFDPFYSARFLGRGLGLSAVAGIARQHGGAVSIESEPGGGTSVTLYLPSVKV